MSNSLRPYTVHRIFQARILEWVALFSSRRSSQPRVGPRSPALQADSLPAEPQGKPKNIGVSSLSLHQWIFPTQESNWGLSHCRWILYQLSYQGSKRDPKRIGKKFFWFFCMCVNLSLLLEIYQRKGKQR